MILKKLNKFFKNLGPGFITGASDDDPSGIATYSQTGAQFGYTQLWTAVFALPFMIVIQEMCGRIGMVTGKGLAGVIRKFYSKKILYFAVSLLLIANTVNIGADLGAMAEATQLLTGISFNVLLIAITAITLILQIFLDYSSYAKFLKYLTISLFAYIVTVFIVNQNWKEVLIDTIVPSFSFNKDYILNIVAIFGTTISPYLFFWQANEEVEEEIKDGKLKTMGVGIPKINNRDIKKMRKDTVIGMVFSNLIMFFIVVTTASTLHTNGITNIETAAQAANALRPLAGDYAFALFALGIIGTGFLAVPVLSASASYAVAESFGWKAGLYRKLKNAHGFYGVITIATIIGLLVNFTDIKPFTMLYYTAVLNGLCAPILMVLILLISNNKKILGKYTNNIFSNILGAVVTLFMGICGLILIYTLIK